MLRRLDGYVFTIDDPVRGTVRLQVRANASVKAVCEAHEHYGKHVVVLYGEPKRACQVPFTEPAPLREALYALTLAEPPEFITNQWWLGELLQSEVEALQQWCVNHARPSWATGISIMEAADRLVQEALDNGNLVPREQAPEKKRRTK
jgi:hypothetical protein